MHRIPPQPHLGECLRDWVLEPGRAGRQKSPSAVLRGIAGKPPATCMLGWENPVTGPCCQGFWNPPFPSGRFKDLHPPPTPAASSWSLLLQPSVPQRQQESLHSEKEVLGRLWHISPWRLKCFLHSWFFSFRTGSESEKVDARQCHWVFFVGANNTIPDFEQLKKTIWLSKLNFLIRTLEIGSCWVGLEKGSAKESNPLHSLFLYNPKLRKVGGIKEKERKENRYAMKTMCGPQSVKYLLPTQVSRSLVQGPSPAPSPRLWSHILPLPWARGHLLSLAAAPALSTMAGEDTELFAHLLLCHPRGRPFPGGPRRHPLSSLARTSHTE